MLHPIKHDNKSQLWCGPAAIAAITGQPTSVITAMLREASGEPRITGVANAPALKVLGDLGYAVDMERHYIGRDRRFSLNEVAGDFSAALEHMAALVVIPGHYVVLHAGKFIDNNYPAPIPVASAPRSDDLVENIWLLRRVGPPQIASRFIKAWNDSTTAQARKLARRYRIGLRREMWDGLKYVLTCPVEVDDVDDIYENDWEAETPDELLRKVKQYAELVEHVRVHGCLC